MMQKETVVVGMSGGVDSSIAALLLCEAGYNVIGVFMKNWDEDDGTEWCSAAQDYDDARAVADRLHIPLHTVNFAAEYWTDVFSVCLDAFAAGHTPNPDILCNRHIKFDPFIAHAKRLGATYVATGHYARLIPNATNIPALHTAIDQNKDQSYFLYAVNKETLPTVLFPLGTMTKDAVRAYAHDKNIPVADKKDSTGICFIGERPFRDFLSRYITTTPGEICDENGRCIGTHDGAALYTIGQRKGLGIGGKQDTQDSPWYVARKDMATNTLIAVQGSDHPLLYTDSCRFEPVNWLDESPQTNSRLAAKIRYRQPAQLCTVTDDKQTYIVHFDTPQRAATIGQSLVLYDNSRCLGGGIITSIS